MDKNEYEKLIELNLMTRLAESCAEELRDKLHKVNEALRELILRKEKPDA